MIPSRPTVALAFLAIASGAFAQNVKVTPLGSHAGELCARDRATIFEDPTGVRILYDAGQSVLGADDPHALRHDAPTAASRSLRSGSRIAGQFVRARRRPGRLRAKRILPGYPVAETKMFGVPRRLDPNGGRTTDVRRSGDRKISHEMSNWPRGGQVK